MMAGTRLSKPNIWRLSKYWAPEQLEGLGSVSFLTSIVEMPNGTIMATGKGSELTEASSWFTSSDLAEWSRANPPGSVQSGSSLSRVGPYVFALSDSTPICIWVTSDGVTWTQILVDSPSPNRQSSGSPMLFGTDGFSIVGLISSGLVSGDPCVFQIPTRAASWETILDLNEVGTIWGSGSERYVVAGGKLSRIEGRRIVEMPEPPVLFSDDTKLYPTESAVFAVDGSGGWVLADDEWLESEIPVLEREGFVVESASGFTMMALDDGQVVRYTSVDGVKWSSSTVAPMAGSYLYYDPSGYFVLRDLSVYESLSEAMESTVHISVDGSYWDSYTLGESLAMSRESAEVNPDGSLVVHTANGVLHFAVPEGAEFHSLVWSEEEFALIRVISENEPYLVLSSASDAEVWIPLTFDDVRISDVWAYGSEVIRMAQEVNLDGESKTVLQVWAPD